MFILIFFIALAAHAYECSIPTEFYRSLPVFLGTSGTMEISSENILVLTNRGQGIQTETKANVTRYFYPGERVEADIFRTLESNGDVTVTTAPKFFNCNVRQAVLREKKILGLSYCTVDGCRHINPEVCEYLVNNFTEEKVRTGRNALATIFETESRVKSLTQRYHREGSVLLRDFEKLKAASPRVQGVSVSDFETDEGISATFGLLQLGGILASETDYCRRLIKGSMFWKEDQRPSKFLPKSQN